jgi:hypothetical protein
LEFPKLPTLQGLGVEISNHFICGTVLDRDVPFFDLIHHQEETDVQCSGYLAGALAVAFQKDSALVILVQYVFLDFFYPCASKNSLVNMNITNTLSTLTSWASEAVLLLVFSFCFLEIDCTAPSPSANDMVAPVWLL